MIAIDLVYILSTCTHNDFFNEKVTDGVSDWWRVDLLKTFHITRIVVYNRIGQPLKLNNTQVSWKPMESA